MKHYPPPSPPAPPRPRKRIPCFHPVPLASRKDGWTQARQAYFIGYLAETGSVLEACRRVSMGRESAYRLRKRPGAAGFAAAWDAALGKSHTPVDLASAKSTGLDAGYRHEHGLMTIHMHAGKLAAVTRKPDKSALFQHLAHLDRACAAIDAKTRAALESHTA